MRPLVLKISAFGPYAGETIIPMHELGTKGLYLITGDTGAGKTTIFDAICYALFGEPSGKKGESREVSMLRSKYADADVPTLVDLTFSHDGKEYRVVRNPEYKRPARNKEGVVKQGANACLYMPDGRIVEKLKEVTAAVEELLGINRDQFSQIAMIAQGEFKKLLLADTKQRQEIFRELFKTSYYQRLQYALETKRKEISGKVEDGKKSVNQYVRDIDVDENDVLALEVDRAKNGELITEDILELIEKIISQDKKIKSKADDELKEINKALEEINAGIGAAEAVTKAKETLKTAEEKLEKEIPEEKQLKIVFENAKTELKKKDGITKKIAEIDVEIEKHQQADRLKSESFVAEKNIKKEEALLEQKVHGRMSLEDSIKSIKEEHGLLKDVGASIEKHKSELSKIKEIKESLAELAADYDNYKKESEKLEKAQAKYAEDNAIFKGLQQVYEAKEQAFRDGQAGILASSLVDGQKCPVCGSTSHPAKAKLTSDIPSEKEVDAAKTEADLARESANASSNQAGSIKTSCELQAQELVRKSKKLFDSGDIDNLNEKIDAQMSDALSNIEKLTQNIKSEEEKAERKKQIEDLIPKLEEDIKQSDLEITSAKENISGMKSAFSENKKQIDELTKALTFSDKSEAEKKKEEYVDFAESLQENYEKADVELKEVTKRIAALNAEIESSKKTLSGATILDIEEENEKKKDFEEKQANVISILNCVGARINRNESVIENIKNQSDKIAETEKQLQWVAALANTANGSLRGKEKIMLETYIQTTYFDRIISRANLRFMKMSGGQYELKRQNEASDSRSQSGLELGVIDHYNGTQRSVKTLSGGESFMASLSLALGLSDEVQSSAGGIKIDTMFVDEGFGSLDSDSLDQAYKALASLTEGNRLVGIISHVAELKNKIDNQVIVKKEKSGGSFVTIQV